MPHDPEIVWCGLGLAGEWREFVRPQMEVMADHGDPEVMRIRFSDSSIISWGTVANLTGLSVEVMLQAALAARWREAAEGGMLPQEMPPVRGPGSSPAGKSAGFLVSGWGNSEQRSIPSP